MGLTLWIPILAGVVDFIITFFNKTYIKIISSTKRKVFKALNLQLHVT
jgi:hypothetical protein